MSSLSVNRDSYENVFLFFPLFGWRDIVLTCTYPSVIEMSGSRNPQDGHSTVVFMTHKCWPHLASNCLLLSHFQQILWVICGLFSNFLSFFFKSDQLMLLVGIYFLYWALGTEIKKSCHLTNWEPDLRHILQYCYLFHSDNNKSSMVLLAEFCMSDSVGVYLPEHCLCFHLFVSCVSVSLPTKSVHVIVCNSFFFFFFLPTLQSFIIKLIQTMVRIPNKTVLLLLKYWQL